MLFDFAFTVNVMLLLVAFAGTALGSLLVMKQLMISPFEKSFAE